ncbi:MAG: hypothetical protein K2X37_11200 [Chitinophagaceae bacterium]|nr:hypothetical protein [Chitinophagaceae bacterium]
MKKIITSLAIMATLFTGVLAQSNADTRKKQFNLSKNNIAIEGYDPVAYFTENKAVEGKKEWSVINEGVVVSSPFLVQFKSRIFSFHSLI